MMNFCRHQHKIIQTAINLSHNMWQGWWVINKPITHGQSLLITCPKHLVIKPTSNIYFACTSAVHKSKLQKTLTKKALIWQVLHPTWQAKSSTKTLHKIQGLICSSAQVTHLVTLCKTLHNNITQYCSQLHKTFNFLHTTLCSGIVGPHAARVWLGSCTWLAF